MFKDFFDFTKPVGLDETWVSIFVVLLCMWGLYKIFKKK